MAKKDLLSVFDIKTDKVNIRKAIYSLNSLLPDDISISEMIGVNNRFHAQKSATYRYYRYRISNKPYRSAFDRNLLHLREELDIDLMNEALEFLLGEHDFSCFKAAKTENPAKICYMYYAKAIKVGDFIYIDFN